MSEWEQESGVKERTNKEWKGDGLYFDKKSDNRGKKVLTESGNQQSFRERLKPATSNYAI